MADLVSPGVSVTVTDESMTTSGSATTVPLFIFATAQDKLSYGSTSTATGTTSANAGLLQLITSQKSVLTTFGSPVFQTDNGSVVQGDELNEYGLHALYSYMGIANRAYAVRADIDLNQLAPTGTAPTGPVSNGTMWLDLSASQVEAYVSSIDSPTTFHDWTVKTVTLVSSEQLEDVSTTNLNVDDLVMRFVPSTGAFMMYKFTATGLVQVNTILSAINNVPTGSTVSEGDIWIRDGYTKNGSNYFGTRFVIKRYASLTSVWTSVDVYTGNTFYEVESKSGSFSTSYVAAKFDSDSESFSFYLKSGSASTVSQAAAVNSVEATSTSNLTISWLTGSVTTAIAASGETATVASIITALNKQSALINAGFSFTNASGLVITNKNGYSFKVSQSGSSSFDTVEIAKLTTDSSNYSKYSSTVLKASSSTPTAVAKSGTYWYDFSNSDNLKVTLYVGNYTTGSWEKVEDDDMYIEVDEPAADRDFWVLPISQGVGGYTFYRNVSGAWSLVDQTDQSTLNGMIFKDFNDTTNVPSANLYQNGMLALDLGNTEGVVKQMSSDGVWKVVSGTALNGSGVFGRAAQRAVIVEALASVVVSNQAIRSESISFNLILAPGYVELLDELVTLNTDRKETAFIITDVPARLSPVSSAIENWATNADNASENGDIGRITNYEYAAQYMGWCLSTNVDGESVAVPGSTIAVRTYAYSDSVSYVWYPPAGTQRGVVSNATSVGYITDEGEYQSVVYNQGQRDTIYTNKINPIAMRPSRGLLVYGDKTLASEDSSALSRVNVARLVVYIRKQLEILAEPFLFRLNTATTRQEFAGVVTSFLSEIVQLNGLYDFTVVCDETNNTSTTIDALELWMDIAIQPTKTINFIYVPIRIESTS